MPRNGTLVICVQNLDFSGANQVVLNIVAGGVHRRFVESGASVRIGNIHDVIHEVRDVFCILCNTIMTAHVVLEIAKYDIPMVWVLHEWWDEEMIVENFRIRNITGTESEFEKYRTKLSLLTVKQAMTQAKKIVFVCERQKQLYQPIASSCVIKVGVPDPLPRMGVLYRSSFSFKASNRTIICRESEDLLLEKSLSKSLASEGKEFTFLCLGIVCPRKNQVWTVELFKLFKEHLAEIGMDNKLVKLQIVGARRTRVYEIEYLEKVRRAIGEDSQIELIDVTDDVDSYFNTADCLILTSTNEVTPMVIPEAMSWSMPVLSTNIAGIQEIMTSGVEGFLFEPFDSAAALRAMFLLYNDEDLRNRMAAAGRQRFEAMFDLDIMIGAYRSLLCTVAPPVVLVDMDGVLVDWDAGFLQVWGGRSAVNRTSSYSMEDCVEPARHDEAVAVWMQQGFFEKLPPMPGGLQALQEMVQEGMDVYICSTPVASSQFCAQEKVNWVRTHLGEDWLEKVILTARKDLVDADILIDDKPMAGTQIHPNWKQVLFDAPYNRHIDAAAYPAAARLPSWKNWRAVLRGVLVPERGSSKAVPPTPPPSRNASGAGLASLMDDASEALLIPTKEEAIRRAATESAVVKAAKRSELVRTVQATHDMLQANPEPLSPEDIASIVSGTVTFLSDDEKAFQDITEELESDQIAAGIISGAVISKESLNFLMKKEQLREKLASLSENHKRKVVQEEKQQALLDADAYAIDGLQIFRSAYKKWRNYKLSK